MSLNRRSFLGGSFAGAVGASASWLVPSGAALSQIARPAEATRHRPGVAITNATVIDPARGPSSAPMTVLIDSGRITAVTPAATARIPRSVQRIDGHGRFLIPGLVDMHVHLFNRQRPPNAWAFPLFIANGITSVREMNARTESLPTIKEWRERRARGELIAPRIFAAGVAVRGRSPEDARVQVEAAAAAGADFIKIFSEVPKANWQVILEAARANSLPVAGHVPATVALLDAANAGEQTSEHLMQAYEACSSIEHRVLEGRQGLDGDAAVARRDADELEVLTAYDPTTCDRVSEALAATHQVQVPTLVLAHTEYLRAKDTRSPSESLPADPRWRFLPADEQERWLRLLAEVAPNPALFNSRWEVSRRIVTALHRAHVPIRCGTDAPMPGVYPGYSLHEEMALLVECGFTPLEALQSATQSAVTVDSPADLVLLDADPLKDIRNTQRIHAVLVDGAVVHRAPSRV